MTEHCDFLFHFHQKGLTPITEDYFQQSYLMSGILSHLEQIASVIIFQDFKRFFNRGYRVIHTEKISFNLPIETNLNTAATAILNSFASKSL